MLKNRKQAPKVRELFVEELAQVRGGKRDPIKEVMDAIGCCETTMACCEEGPDGCCSGPY